MRYGARDARAGQVAARAGVLHARAADGRARRRCAAAGRLQRATLPPPHATPLMLMRRCADLLLRMTTPEKLGLLTNTALGVPRLFIPPYQWRVPLQTLSL